MSATVTTYSPKGGRVPPSDLQYECLHFMLRRAGAQRLSTENDVSHDTQNEVPRYIGDTRSVDSHGTMTIIGVFRRQTPTC